MYFTIDFCTNLYYIVSMNTSNVPKTLQTLLEIEATEIAQTDIYEQIKQLCLIRFCKAVGIRCQFNIKNKFMNFFAIITGQAVCNVLKINLQIAPDCLRLVRYNGINFVNEAMRLLQNEDKDEAFIDIFNLIDNNKPIMNEIYEKYYN